MSEKKKNGDASGNYIFNRKYEPLIYLIPFAIGLLIFTIYPIINVVIMSVKEGYRLGGNFNGWGLGNYDYVIHNKDFLSSIKNSFIYVFTVVPIATVIAIVIANLLNQKIKGAAIFQTAYFLPTLPIFKSTFSIPKLDNIYSSPTPQFSETKLSLTIIASSKDL